MYIGKNLFYGHPQNRKINSQKNRIMNFSINLKRGFSAVVAAVAIIASLSSCSDTKKIAYMQNNKYGEEEVVLNVNRIKIQPEDKISIVVSCKEPELARLFNLVQVENRVGIEAYQTSQGRVSVYTVDANGDIDFPVLGKIHIAGLDRDQVAEKIRKDLVNGHWVSDAVVSVEFANLHYSVIGEVAKPGSYSIVDDRMTLFEALSKAGDLTPYGEREVTVVREEGGKRVKYLVDLKDANLFESPAYYIQQNDVIYVTPNKTIGRRAEDNPNNLKSISLWTSIASLLTTVAVLIWK